MAVGLLSGGLLSVTLLHGNLYIIKFSIKRRRLSLVYGRQKVSAPTKGY